MLRVTTLLLVALLGGGPFGSLLCESWCATPIGGAHHRLIGCHDRAEPTGGPQLVSVLGCRVAAAVAPFLTEARQSAPGTLLSVGAMPEPPLADASARPTASHRSGRAELVPGAPPTHQILRI